MGGECTEPGRPVPFATLAPMRRYALALVVLGAVMSACGGSSPVSLDVSTKTGYAVIVEQTASTLSIGFAENRDAPAGQPYEVTQAVWRGGGRPRGGAPRHPFRTRPRGGGG